MRITLNEIEHEYRRINELYKCAGLGGIENGWYRDAMDNIKSLIDMYGPDVQIELVEINPNTFACQPSISESNYRTLREKLEIVNFEAFPVVVGVHPDFSANNDVSLDGHTRQRIYNDAGLSSIRAYRLSGGKGDVVVRNSTHGNLAPNGRRPLRIGEIPLSGQWDHNGTIEDLHTD